MTALEQQMLAALKRAEFSLEDIRTHWRPVAPTSYCQALRESIAADHAAISAVIAHVEKLDKNHGSH